MQSVKSSVKSMVEKHQKRILVMSIDHNGELVYKGDNVSFANFAENVDAQTTMKRILSEVLSESETSYNFTNRELAYTETANLELPKMITKIGGKRWKGAMVAKTLSTYMTLLGFGLNSKLAYGNKEDKPAWWPRRPKWKYFRGPSRASKEETTTLIRLLLEHYNVNPDIHYVGYPEEEDDSSSEESNEESSDDDDNDDAENDAREDGEQDEEVQLNVDHDVGRMENMEEEYERFQERELQSNNNRKNKKVRRNYVNI